MNDPTTRAEAEAAADRQAWDEGRAADEVELERRHSAAADEMARRITEFRPGDRIKPEDRIVVDVAPTGEFPVDVMLNGETLFTGVSTSDPRIVARARRSPQALAADEMARRAMMRALVSDLGGEQAVRMLHEQVETELRQLRGTRDEANARIRTLVEEERVLALAVTRFDRLAEVAANTQPTTDHTDTTEA